MTPIDRSVAALTTPGRHWLCGVANGMEAMLLPELARAQTVLMICLDDRQAATLEEQLAFFAPDLPVLRFPAWDCLPYDRVSPSVDITAQRLDVLSRLSKPSGQPFILLCTVNAALQRTVPRSMIAASSRTFRPGNSVDGDNLQLFLADNGYTRVGTVMEPGDFAVRGGLIDLFPPNAPSPVRLDFFGDTLEGIRSIDPQTQRTTDQLKEVVLIPASEVLLNQQSVSAFRKNYAQVFGGIDVNDPLYESVTAQRRYQGMEHWLPLFHDQLETIFDYLPDAPVVLTHEVEESIVARHEQIAEFYDARREAATKDTFGAAPYKPVPTGQLYVPDAEWKEITSARVVLAMTPFERPEERAISFGARKGRSFAAERAEQGVNVYDAVRTHVQALQSANKRAVIATWTEGSMGRLASILSDHDVKPIAPAANWQEITARDPSKKASRPTDSA
jgi:transcription-repair coupling factor (superfamily II helicase)